MPPMTALPKKLGTIANIQNEAPPPIYGRTNSCNRMNIGHTILDIRQARFSPTPLMRSAKPRINGVKIDKISKKIIVSIDLLIVAIKISLGQYLYRFSIIPES